MEEFLKFLEIGLEVFEAGHGAQDFLFAFFLTFARFFAFVWVAPFFGGKLVPPLVRIAAAAALVVVTYPSVTAEISAAGGPAGLFGAVGFAGLLAKEIFIGFTLGFVASLVFEAARTAGRIADYQRGAALGELLAPPDEESVSDLGRFKFLSAIVIFVTSGAHLFFIGSLVKSFEFLPVTRFPEIGAGWSQALEFLAVSTAGVISLGVQLAAPVIVTLLLTDLFFGLLNRAAPEVNAFFLSLPVKMWLGILVVVVMLPFLFAAINDSFSAAFEAFEFMIRSLSRTGP